MFQNYFQNFGSPASFSKLKMTSVINFSTINNITFQKVIGKDYFVIRTKIISREITDIQTDKPLRQLPKHTTKSGKQTARFCDDFQTVP